MAFSFSFHRSLHRLPISPRCHHGQPRRFAASSSLLAHRHVLRRGGPYAHCRPLSG